MFRKIEDLRTQVEEFVEQPDYPLLVLGCADGDLSIVLKVLEGAEPNVPDALLMAFPHPFHSPLQYVTHCVEALRAQLQQVNAERAARGAELVPEPPAAAVDVHRPPAERLPLLLQYLLEEFVPPDGGHLVAALLPLEVHDRRGYAEVVGSVVPWPGAPAWMQRVRTIVRDDRDALWLKPELDRRRVDTALYLAVDFGTGAMTASLGQDAADPDVPVEQRMGALLQLAFIDYSHRRHREAQEKFTALLEWYGGQGQPMMQALCYQGLGDTAAATGRGAVALERYRQGLAVAMESQALPVVLNLAMAAGRMCLQVNEPADAEDYFASAVDVARGAMNPFAAADALEALGEAQYARQKWGEAAQSWERCVAVAERVGHGPRRASALAHLRVLYVTARMDARVRDVDARIATAGGTTASGEGVHDDR